MVKNIGVEGHPFFQPLRWTSAGRPGRCPRSRSSAQREELVRCDLASGNLAEEWMEPYGFAIENHHL